MTRLRTMIVGGMLFLGMSVVPLWAQPAAPPGPRTDALRVQQKMLTLQDRREVLTADPESDVILDTSVVVDTKFRHVKMRKPAGRGSQSGEFYWTVDLKTRRYRTFTITDPVKDAERIFRHLQRLGVAVTRDSVQAQVAQWRTNQTPRPAQQLLARRADSDDPTRGGPRADDVPAGALEPAAQYQACYSMASIDGFEPGAWFGATELTETGVHLLLSYWEGEWDADGYPICWANPDSFIGTSWFQANCNEYDFVYQTSGGGIAQIEAVTDASYYNADFVDPTGGGLCVIACGLETWIYQRALVTVTPWGVEFGWDHYDTGEGHLLIHGYNRLRYTDCWWLF